jgi:mRNA interferase MazF
LRRGDVVLVVMPGDYGKPRPAVVVQSDEMIRFGFSSVVVCPMTSSLTARPSVRIVVDPDRANGLAEPSEVMVEKLVGLSTGRVRRVIGRLDGTAMASVDRALFVVLGLGRTRS